jgi:radical SAM protein with 4Fe4S-binding SPASM domain
MDCVLTHRQTDQEYFQALMRRAEAARVPLSGTLELTRRCNLTCVHCYLGPQVEQRRLREREMDTAQVAGILDQVAAAGCLDLLITGGEPFLRPDFAAVYRHARLAGIDVTVFTNATLVAPATIELFQDLPPRMVEITLYGATAATYERVTGVPGSFRRCLAGIERLLAGGIRVGLKTVVMTLNHDEYDAMEAIARRYGVRFRMDAALNGTLANGREPLALRLSPSDIVRLEQQDERRRLDWRQFYERFGRTEPTDTLVACGAGEATFHIDPFGHLHPCLMIPWMSVDLLGSSFAAGWAEIGRLRDTRVEPGYQCASCEMRSMCSHCPGFVAFENDGAQKPSAFLCALGRERVRAVTSPNLS